MEKDKYKPMVCPVCGDFYFSEWQDGDEDCEFYCLRCGWKYDIEQSENLELAHKTNELSVNEYKNLWQKKLKENPYYDYSEENCPPDTPHKCPICHKYEFKNIGCFDICPFCGWEDDDVQLNEPDYAGGANELSLNAYREKYEKLIAENPKYKWIKSQNGIN